MDINHLIKKVEIIAKEAGAFIRRERESFELEKVEQKGFNDLVSYVDKTAEEIIVEGLSGVFPEAGFITEEGTRKEQQKEYTWIVDPLDGTTNFVHGVPVFSVSIALADQKGIIAGVVYEVNLDECFTAVRGLGAKCNGKPIRVSPVDDFSRSLIATGFPYDHGGKLDKYLDLLKYLLKNTHGLRRLGSAAVDLCYVACGRVEGYMEYNLQPYDVAAGTIIVQEAGGKVTDFSGGNNFVFGAEIVATNGRIHEKFREEIQAAFSF
ncbi:inositol monophosphatase family protein [Negadavirga shengliensis]|uniref:Inositol-1-monophosphatase n=1 Tax=Negadavirga shengliensis TaxID=1389218 RepID=A0ABV9SY42_9BACT